MSTQEKSELHRLHDLMTETLLKANGIAKSEGIDTAAFAEADAEHQELVRKFRELKSRRGL